VAWRDKLLIGFAVTGASGQGRARAAQSGPGRRIRRRQYLGQERVVV